MNRLVPEVGEQLAGADHSSLHVLVGRVLQELTRAGLKLGYAYSRAKSAASKSTTLSDALRAEADLAKKEAEEARAETTAVRHELGEANKKLFAAEKKVTVLTKDLEAADRFEETIESLSADVDRLQDERTSLRQVLLRLKDDKDAQVVEANRLREKVDALETAGLELFFDFWKANPQANFDYLGDAKEMYLEYCAAQVAYGGKEVDASTSGQASDQAADASPAQTTDPPAPVGSEEPNPEPGTPAV
ncbi:hypothetical protein CsatA_028926 [Cannabis sativa]